MKKHFIWLAIVAIGAVCFYLGCGQKAKYNNVVVRVNNYTMTVEDLQDEIMYSSYAAYKMPNIKEALDLAVRKQLLIQEAQRQGLDRNKTFLKTIERYWEQALIKELLQKETQKIYENVSKDKQAEALNAWMEGLYKKAKIEINEDVLKDLEVKK